MDMRVLALFKAVPSNKSAKEEVNYLFWMLSCANYVDVIAQGTLISVRNEC